MCEWQQRVIDEKAELDDRLGKLRAFMGTAACLDLTMADRVLLVEQERAMSSYSGVLAKRIERFSGS